MAKILFRKPFIEAMEDFPESDKSSILEKIEIVFNNIQNNNFSNIVKLRDIDLFRFRERNYRIIFDYGENEEKEKVMDIFFVAPRDYVYDVLYRNYQNFKNKEFFEKVWLSENYVDKLSAEDFDKPYLPKKRELPAYFIYKKEIKDISVSDVIEKCKQQIYDINETTTNILNSILNKVDNDVFLLQGVPGTGKSLLLYNLARNFASKSKYSLIIVPTENLKNELYLKNFKLSNILVASLDDSKDRKKFFTDFTERNIGILTFSEFLYILDKDKNREIKTINMQNILTIKNIMNNFQLYHIVDNILQSLEPEKIYFMYLCSQSDIDYLTTENRDYLFSSIRPIYQHFIESKLFKILKSEIKDNPIKIINEIDLKRIKELFPKGINLLVDEAQEFFIKENLFLFNFWSILREDKINMRNEVIVFAGDIFQRCFITDFRFDELKTQIYKQNKNIRDITLDISFRLPSEIAQYANKYVSLFLNYFPSIRQFPVIKPDNCIKSCAVDYPIAITGNYNTFIEGLKNMDEVDNKRLIVIYNKKDESNILKLKNQFKFIYEIRTDLIKGLEYDNILVYNVFFEESDKYDNFEEVSKIYLSLTRCLSSCIHFVEYYKISENDVNLFGFEKVTDSELSKILSNLLQTHRKDQELIIIRNLIEKLESNFEDSLFFQTLKKIDEYSKERGYDKIELYKIIKKLLEICQIYEVNYKDAIEYENLPPLVKGLMFYEDKNYLEAIPLLFEADKEIFNEKINDTNLSLFDLIRLRRRVNNNIDLLRIINDMIKRKCAEKNIDEEIIGFLDENIEFIKNINDMYYLFIIEKFSFKIRELLNIWK